jgi:hypothetical protein
LQEEVDEDLIIAVRRGNEFQDAYQACMTRDLRKKYKIVFFNQQGLEEEGVDGGGIIKEFINRVLRYASPHLEPPLAKTTDSSWKPPETRSSPIPTPNSPPNMSSSAGWSERRSTKASTSSKNSQSPF